MGIGNVNMILVHGSEMVSFVILVCLIKTVKGAIVFSILTIKFGFVARIALIKDVLQAIIA
jgi:hypothetical protein